MYACDSETSKIQPSHGSSVKKYTVIYVSIFLLFTITFTYVQLPKNARLILSTTKPDELIVNRTEEETVLTLPPLLFLAENKIPKPVSRKCPVKHVVTVNRLGQLGNYMWEYAALWAYAKHHDYEPYIPDYMLETMEKIFDRLTIPPLSYLTDCSLEETPLAKENDGIEQRVLNNGTVTFIPPMDLEHYSWLTIMSLKYIEELRKEFTFEITLVDRSTSIIQYVVQRSKKNVTTIGVHVRRGDYMQYLSLNLGYATAPRAYYTNAMDYFRSRYVHVAFLVVSDDVDWCWEHLAAEDVFVMSNTWTYSFQGSAEQDLALMAHCDHTIVDYGTFGDWGALLAGGETVVYNLTVGVTQGLARHIPKWKVMNY